MKISRCRLRNAVRASVAPSRRRSLSSTKSLSPETSGEDEDPDVASKLGMCNREIVRRGALILFCDYVVSVRMPAVAGSGFTQLMPLQTDFRPPASSASEKLNLNPAPNYNGKSDSDLVPGVEVRLQKAGSAITCSGHLQRWVPLSSSVTVLMGRNYKSE